MVDRSDRVDSIGSAEPAADAPQRMGTDNPLQWFRESITAIISLVILVAAVRMMTGTYHYAQSSPFLTSPPGDAAARKEAFDQQKDAFERQKDIMLYALALLGTVTGYYLGRVPAELHAQQAQKTAANAQAQLQKTQTTLSDTASTAATAASQAAIAQNENSAAQTKLRRAAGALKTAQEALRTVDPGDTGRPAPEAVREELPARADTIRRAREEVELMLRELE